MEFSFAIIIMEIWFENYFLSGGYWLLSRTKLRIQTNVCTNCRWFFSVNSNFWKLQKLGVIKLDFSVSLLFLCFGLLWMFSFGLAVFFWESNVSLLLGMTVLRLFLDTGILLKFEVERKSNFLFSFLSTGGWLWLRFRFSCR